MHSKPTALTLLEVVAALAILSTLLVAVLTAQNRLARQTRRAELRLEAIAAADQLLAAWTSTTPMMIPDVRGELAHDPPLYWQLTRGDDQSLQSFGVQIAHLQVSDQPDMEDSERPPLATVEFLSTAAIPLEAVP